MEREPASVWQQSPATASTLYLFAHAVGYSSVHRMTGRGKFCRAYGMTKIPA